MSESLPEGAQRVQEFLTTNNISRKISLLADTAATAQDAANALGVPISHIGKSIVFETDRGVIVVVISGDERVDTNALARLLEVSTVKQLRADDVKKSTGFTIGGVSPFALPASIKVIIESRLQSFDQCYVAAGHPKTIVRIEPQELINLTKGIVLPISMSHNHSEK